MYSVVGYHFDLWIRDPGWVTNQDPGFGSGNNNPNHISGSLETIFWVDIFLFFDADPDPRSATLPRPKKGNEVISLFNFSLQHDAKK